MHENGPDGRRDDGNHQGQKDAVCHALLHLPEGAGSVLLGGEDGKSRGEACAKAEEEEHDGAGRTHGPQGIRPDEAADDDRVHHIIELLEDIPDEKRDHKAENQGQGFPHRHIRIAGLFLLFHYF